MGQASFEGIRASSARASLLRSTALTGLALAAGAIALPGTALAQDRTYTGTVDTNWNTAGNWTGGVPDTPAETAVFQNNGAPATVTLNGLVFVGAIRSDANAPARTINVNGELVIYDTGVNNQSSSVQTLNLGGPSITSIQFQNSADIVGTQTDIVVNSDGQLQFAHQSNATKARADIRNNGLLVVEKDSGSLTLGALTGSGAVTGYTGVNGNQSQALIVGGLNLDSTYSGQITQLGGSTLSLTVAGTGTLTLTGNNNDYTGGTTITSSATLQIGNGGALGSGTVTFGNGRLRAASSMTLSNQIILNPGASGTLSAAAGQTLTFNAGDGNGHSGLSLTPAAGTALHFGTATDTGTVVFTPASTGITGGTGLDLFVDGGTARGSSGGLGLITDVTGSTMTVAAGATLDFTGAGTPSIQSLFGSGTVSHQGGTTNIRSGNFGGNLTGTQNLALTRGGTSGVLTLTGANTYTGTTTVNTGSTLILGNGGTTGSIAGTQPITLNGTGTLTVNRSDAVTLANAIVGTGAITKSGTGTTALTGANTYSGTTTISDGTLQVGNGGTTGSLGSGNVVDNATLAFKRSDDITFSQAISGSGNLVHLGDGLANDNGTLTLTGNNTYGGTTTVGLGKYLYVGNGGTSGSLGTGDVTTLGSVTFNRSDDITVANHFSDFGGITFAGSGTTTFTSENNTYRSGTAFEGGTVQYTGSTAVFGIEGLGSLFIFDGHLRSMNGGSLNYNISTSNQYTQSTLSTAAGTVLTLGGNGSAPDDSLFGTLHLGSATDTGEIVWGHSNSDVDRPNVDFYIDGGKVTATAAGLGKITAEAASTQIAAGATLDFNGRNATILNLQGAGTLLNAGFTTTLKGGNFSGTIGANQGVVIDTDAVVTLSGNNSQAGTPIRAGGVLTLASSGALGLGGSYVSSGGAIQFQGGITIGRDIELEGTGVSAGGALRNLSGINYMTGAVALVTDARINSDGGLLNLLGSFDGRGHALTLGGAGGVAVYSALGANVTSLTKDGAGIAALAGTNTYTGPTTVSAGYLDLYGGSAIADSGAVTVDTLGTLRLFGTETIGSLTGSGNVILGAGGSANTLTTGDGNSALFSGVISEGAGAGSLVKQGGGTFTLTGTNTYTGATTIGANGTLQLGNGGTTGSIAGASNVALTGTLVLDRSDDVTFANAVSGTGAIVNNGTGLLRVTNANSFSGGTTINAGTVEVGAASALGTGVITLGGTSALSSADTFTLANRVTIGAGAKATISAETGKTLTLTGTGPGNGNAQSAFNLDLTAPGTELHFGSATDTGTVALTGGSIGTQGASSFTLAIDGGTARGAIFGVLSDLSSTTTVASGATLDFGGLGGTIRNLAGAGTVLNDGGVTDVRGGAFSGVFGGTQDLRLVSGGSGTLVLTGANTYTGDTTINTGTALQVGNGGTAGSIASTKPIIVDGTLTVARSDATTLAGAITGAGTVNQSGTGTTTLAGTYAAGGSFTGTVNVDSGTLLLDGELGDSANNQATMVVDAGATLGGHGTFYGSATVNGTLAPGNSPGTMTFADLTFGAGSILAYDLGTPGVVGNGVSDLVNVTGTLTLDGTLNINPVANYGAGYYRLFNYGSLVDNGLDLGVIPGGYTPTLQFGIDHQVNLLLSDGAQVVQYWDGTDSAGSSNAANGDGGDGAWTASGTNWTTPAFGINDTWKSQVGVFAGAAGGAVTVTGTQTFQELRFQTDGYTLGGGGSLAMSGGFGVLDVSPGVTATIGTAISGNGLTKTGTGTLVLSGADTYTGVTTVSAGVLNVRNGAALGTTAAGTTVASGAALEIQGGINLGTEALTLNGTGVANGGALRNVAGANTVGGAITLGSATRINSDAGTLTLSGALSGGGNALTVGGAGNVALSGVASNLSALTKDGAGTLTLSAANTYTGLTTVSAGTLALTAAGSLAGAVQNNATLTNAGTIAGLVTNTAALTSTGTLNGGLANSGTASLSGAVGGAVSNTAGTITLTGATTGIGAFTQSAGATFALTGNSTTVGSLAGAGNVTLGSATLTAGGNNGSTSFTGTISGAGGFTKTGTGTQTLGAQTYTGATTVSAGTLALTGNLASSAYTVAAGATLTSATGSTLSATGTPLTITNSGSITNTNATGRAINIGGSNNNRTITITNNAGGLIESVNDAVRVNFNPTGGAIKVDNYGTIRATSAGDGQAIDFNAIVAGAGTVAINNYATGQILSLGDDAIRPGQGAVVTNAGLIKSDGATGSSFDAIDWRAATGTVVNQAGGTITGLRHGITADTDVNVTNSGTIIGRNGSGVGSDGTGTVVNLAGGVIKGDWDGAAANGDGDGVDIDGLGSVDNAGLITGLTAAGVDSGGRPNSGQGVAMGGGSITNRAGGQIVGGAQGVLVNLDTNPGGAAVGATTIVNAGSIKGNTAEGIMLVGAFADTITNSGAIVGSNGVALDMGDGNDTLNATTDASFTGTVVGGAGTDTINLTLGTAATSTLAANSGFEVLHVASGRWSLAAPQSFAVGTIDTGATLDMASNALTLGGLSGAGNLVLGSATLIDGDATSTSFSGVISGSGGVTKVGAGTLTLSGANTYTGATTINAGTLALGADEVLANGSTVLLNAGATFDLANHAETVGALFNGAAGGGTIATGATGHLIVGGGNGDFGFSGVFTGTGDIDKAGTGTFTYASTAASTARLNALAGTLLLSGTTGGAVRVAGGTLTGAAVIGGNLSVSSGTVSPGTTTQPIAAFRAASLNVSGGNLLFDVAGSAGGFLSDQIQVTGAATLTGGTVAVHATEANTGYKISQFYTVVQAGSLTGTFANGQTMTATTSNDPSLRWRLRYDVLPNSVVVELRKQIDFAQGLVNPTENQLAVAGGLNGAAFTASNAYAAILDQIASGSVAQRQATFDSISGEAIADIGTTSLLAARSFSQMLRGRIGGAGTDDATAPEAMAGRGRLDALAKIRASAGEGRTAAAADGSGIGFWVAGFGSDGKLDGRSGVGSADVSQFYAGAAVGVDGRFGNLSLGLGAATTKVQTHVHDRASHSDGSLFQAGAYLAYDDGATFANAIGTYYKGDIDSVREVAVNGGAFGQAKGTTETSGYTASAAAGHRFEMGGGYRLTPQVSFGAAHLKRDGFTETGAGVLSLAVAQDKRDVYQATGELRLSHRAETRTGWFEPYLGVGVRTLWGDRDAAAAMLFTGAPTGTGAFVVQGAELPKLAGIVTAGIDAKLSDQAWLGLGANATVGGRQREGGLNLSLRIGF